MIVGSTEDMPCLVIVEFFRQVNDHVCQRVNNKIKETNIAKTIIHNPHFKTLICPDIHRLTFDTLNTIVLRA